MTSELLQANIDSLEKQLGWLKRSYASCRRIGRRKNYSRGEFDRFEMLSGRFARTIDFLVRRVFRTLDDIEFESQGTLIDVVNNAHKRGLFEATEDIASMRDLRNEIVHEYLDEDMKENFSELLELTPKLIDVVTKTIHYADRYLG